VKVRATINGIARWQTQEVAAQSGYNSQTLVLHFGLGNATTIDSVRLEWQSGTTETFVNQPTNRTITFAEGIGPTSVNQNSSVVPSIFSLEQNFPNPFNPSTTIGFSVGSPSDKVQGSGFTTLKVFDVLGREVQTLVQRNETAGAYVVEFDAANLPSGVDYYRLIAGNFTQTKRMILIR
jgi:hypothetical protein